MTLVADSVMQKLKAKRSKNMKVRKAILNRKGTLDVTDPKKVQEHIEKLKKKKPIPKEKFLTPLEEFEAKKVAKQELEDKKTKKIKVKAKKVVSVKKTKKTKKTKKVSTANMVKVNEKPAKIEKIAMYVPFSKVDEDKKLVSGIATSEAIDSYGDIVRITAIEKALPEYLEFSNIREMHGPSAVGTIKEHDLNMEKKNLSITVKVVDDSAWEKVVETVYKGFSIGGNIIDAIWLEIEVPVSVVNAAGEMDELTLKQYADGELTCKEDEETVTVFTGGFEILELELTEISLVDRPACPEALIDSFKSRDKTFTPDRAFVFKDTSKMKKSKKVLTTKNKLNNLAESLQTQQNPYKTLNSLAHKFTMSKKKQVAKALTAVLKFLKTQGVDLSDGVLDKAGSVNVNRQELRDIVDIAVEKSMNFKKDEGDEEEKSDEEESESKDTDEGDSTEDEDTKSKSEEDDDADEGESDDDESKEDEEDADEKDEDEKEDEDEDEEEEKEESDSEEESDEEEEEEEEEKEEKESDLEKVLKKTLAPFVKDLSDLKTDVKKINKSAAATSTQKGMNGDEADDKNSNKMFKGLFS